MAFAYEMHSDQVGDLGLAVMQVQLLVDLTGSRTARFTEIDDGDERWNAMLMDIEHSLLDVVRHATDVAGSPMMRIDEQRFEDVHGAMLRLRLLARLTSSSDWLLRSPQGEAEAAEWNSMLLRLSELVSDFVGSAQSVSLA